MKCTPDSSTPGSPSNRSRQYLDFLRGYSVFTFSVKLFTFHNDELCGYVHGSLTVKS